MKSFQEQVSALTYVQSIILIGHWGTIWCLVVTGITARESHRFEMWLVCEKRLKQWSWKSLGETSSPVPKSRRRSTSFYSFLFYYIYLQSRVFTSCCPENKTAQSTRYRNDLRFVLSSFKPRISDLVKNKQQHPSHWNKLFATYNSCSQFLILV